MEQWRLEHISRRICSQPTRLRQASVGATPLPQSGFQDRMVGPRVITTDYVVEGFRFGLHQGKKLICVGPAARAHDSLQKSGRTFAADLNHAKLFMDNG